ncbi:MAG: SOS response-associated peptidase [Bacteroidia bacterium]
MCGRYTLVSKVEVIKSTFNVNADFPHFFNPNIAAADQAPVITSAAPNQLQLFQFGMQPPWATKSMLLLNARMEGDQNPDDNMHYRGSPGIIYKPAFRKPIRTQRCLIPADAFIEGPKEARLQEPFLVFQVAAHKPFAFAGLWEQWKDLKTGQWRTGFCIITRPPLPVVQQLGHHRSPLVIAPEHYHTWLNAQAELHDISQILSTGHDQHDWNAYPLHRNISKAANKDLYILQPQGVPVLPLEQWRFVTELKLSGMGASQAREKRQQEQHQLRLFK